MTLRKFGSTRVLKLVANAPTVRFGRPSCGLRPKTFAPTSEATMSLAASGANSTGPRYSSSTMGAWRSATTVSSVFLASASSASRDGSYSALATIQIGLRAELLQGGLCFGDGGPGGFVSHVGGQPDLVAQGDGIVIEWKDAGLAHALVVVAILLVVADAHDDAENAIAHALAFTQCTE